MKVFIVLATCLVSVVSAGHLGGYKGAQLAGPAAYGPGPVLAAAGPVLTGQSSQFREEDSYGNYKFGYDESHASGATGRREERHGDVVTGSYNLAVQDGRSRRVNYIADNYGFRATVDTNEEGVDSSRDPAAVLINKQGYAAAPVVVEAAPAPLALPAPAPLALPAPAPLALPAPIAPVNAGYGAPIHAPIHAPAPLALPAPLPAAPVYAPAPIAAPIIAEAPREAFSYSFGTQHPSYAQAPIALPAPRIAAYPAPAPVAAPIFQQRLEY